MKNSLKSIISKLKNFLMINITIIGKNSKVYKLYKPSIKKSCQY